MTQENPFGKNRPAGEPVDARAITAKVLRRDQWRIWILGVICLIAWMAVVMLPWATILPMMAKVVSHQAAVEGATSPPRSDSPEERIELLRIVKVGTMATFFGSIGSMFVAAICTISLIILTRRATMRQVNASLAEISAQLKLLAEKK